MMTLDNITFKIALEEITKELNFYNCKDFDDFVMEITHNMIIQYRMCMIYQCAIDETDNFTDDFLKNIVQFAFGFTEDIDKKCEQMLDMMDNGNTMLLFDMLNNVAKNL